MKLTLKKFVLFFALISSFVNFAFAQTEREKGIKLYEEGEYKNATTVLKKAVSQNSKDITTSHYLALSLEKDGNTKEATKIFESNIDNTLKSIAETIENRSGNIIYPTNDKVTAQMFVQRKIGDEIKAALASGKRLEEINSKQPVSDRWQNKFLSLQYFVENTGTETKADGNQANITPSKIIKKPFAGYSISARNNKVSGTVRLWILFLSNGKIGLIVPLRRLPDGLTEKAIDAAKGITFTPATKDGNPISVAKQIEYSFAIDLE